MHGSFLPSWVVWSVTFGRRLVRKEKGTRLMCVYCATNKHDHFFFVDGVGTRGAFSWTSTSSRSIKNAKRTRTRTFITLQATWMENASEDTTKSENGEWEIKHYNFFLCFLVLNLLFIMRNIYFSWISMFAFKNNQLNSRNEKIDDKERSELRGTDFFQEQIYEHIFAQIEVFVFLILQYFATSVWLCMVINFNRGSLILRL